MVDVDDLAGVASTEIGWQNLHVACQDHRVATDLVIQPADFGERRRLVRRVHRHVMERDAVPFDEGLEGVVVGNDAGNLDVEFARLPARQQIVETMLLFADQDHHPPLDRRIADLPGHRQIVGQYAEALAEFGQMKR